MPVQKNKERCAGRAETRFWACLSSSSPCGLGDEGEEGILRKIPGSPDAVLGKRYPNSSWYTKATEAFA